MFHSPIQFGRSGYRPIFHAEQINACPACSRSHWYVGRITAECAFCGSALPLAEASGTRHPAASRLPC